MLNLNNKICAMKRRNLKVFYTGNKLNHYILRKFKKIFHNNIVLLVFKKSSDYEFFLFHNSAAWSAA